MQRLQTPVGTAGDWFEIVADAARELTPVSVEVAGPRRVVYSYLEEVGGTGTHAHLILAPFPDDCIPEGTPLHVSPVKRGTWRLHAVEARRAGPGRVSVALGSARFSLLSAEPRPTLATAHGLVVLVVPGGMDDRSSYIFPVSRVAQDFCEIETTEAFEPGVRLEPVELMGDRRVLRHASAQVLATTPLVRADGTRLFRTELSLRPAPAKAQSPHDLVTETPEVRRLLRMAGMMHAPGWYEAPGWGRGALKFDAVDDTEARVLLQGSRGEGLPPLSIRVGVELFAVQYELEVRVLRMAGAEAQTTLPLILRRRRSHRRAQLVSVPDAEAVSLTFVNPVNGETQRRVVSALSFFSLCFRADLADDGLWPGAPLERAQLEWRGRLIHLGDLEIAERDDAQAQATTLVLASDSRLADDADLIALIAVCAHPDVLIHGGEDFSSLHEAYVKAELFAPHMHRNLAPILDQATEVWRRMHSGAADVVRTLVHGPEGAVDGAVTVMRAWETTWVAQHFVDVSPSFNNATGKLQTAYLDHLLPRPDGRFLVFFIKSDNHVMQAYMKRFFGSVGTLDAATTHTVELWVHDGEDGGTERIDRSRGLEPGERQMVEHACERVFGKDATAALSMVSSQLELPDTRERFAKAGLERRRHCRVVEHDARVAYVLLEERTTPGINLTWMLNATWVIPVHASDDEAELRAALDTIVARPFQSPTGERFVNLVAGLDEELLAAAGFERLASVEMFVLNRAGVHQFFQYASRRYGELDARAGLRSRRRAVAAAAAEDAGS